MTLHDLMKTVALFHGLSDDQLQRLIDISQEETFDEGAFIFRQDDDGDKLYMVASGQVEVRVRAGADGPERSQVYLGRGQLFGEMALLDRGKRSASVQCSRDGTVLRAIGADAFHDLCRADTALGYIIMRNIAQDLSFKLRHRNLDLGAGSR